MEIVKGRPLNVKERLKKDPEFIKKMEEYAKKYEERYKLRVADIKETFKDEKMQAEVDAEYLRRMNEFHAKVGMK